MIEIKNVPPKNNIDIDGLLLYGRYLNINNF
ncbi:hypothetical protein J2787_002345 [Chryseobacterium rhizosphaerae]|uniref:Uncharacterized protein n=1 Tax=Chryseobacterium rhizosphaerae TaxID=395937 RepID=A0AAE3YAI7_9FLAO|nr:hypothetical protein [Chryseobacterium rhizosphaerae]